MENHTQTYKRSDVKHRNVLSYTCVICVVTIFIQSSVHSSGCQFNNFIDTYIYYMANSVEMIPVRPRVPIQNYIM